MKYDPSKAPTAQGGDYRPHYRKDEVDAHLAYLAEAHAAEVRALQESNVQAVAAASGYRDREISRLQAIVARLTQEEICE